MFSIEGYMFLAYCFMSVAYFYLKFPCTINSKINYTPEGVYLPISKLHLISSVANLLAHNNFWYVIMSVASKWANKDLLG